MDTLLPFIIEKASAWVRAQRAKWRPDAAPLQSAIVERFASYFSADTLSRVRILEVDGVGNPPFYEELRARGFENLINFGDMLGVTFDDTIALRRQAPQQAGCEHLALLFHELVHVAQYDRLGLDRFIHHYVTSWAQSGFRYERIILEMHAYGLEREFTTSRSPFSVDQRLNVLMTGMR